MQKKNKNTLRTDYIETIKSDEGGEFIFFFDGRLGYTATTTSHRLPVPSVAPSAG